MRTGLGKDLEPFAARLTYPRYPFGGRDVEDHDRLVDEGCQRNHPVEGFRLASARMADAVVARRPVAVGDEPLACP